MPSPLGVQQPRAPCLRCQPIHPPCMIAGTFREWLGHSQSAPHHRRRTLTPACPLLLGMQLVTAARPWCLSTGLVPACTTGEANESPGGPSLLFVVRTLAAALLLSCLR